MSTMSQCLKRAWVRNQDAPPGRPAKGRINCPCGKAPESDYKPENGDVICECGTVYSWNGWIQFPRGITKCEPV